MTMSNENLRITELISQDQGTAFSFEVLPPLKGAGIHKPFYLR